MVSIIIETVQEHPKSYLELATGFLTPLIAIIAVYIAYQQWRLGKRRWRLDLYDKRFETYRAVMEFIGNRCLYGACSADELLAFHRKASFHRFLFAPNIQQYIDQLHSQAQEQAELAEQIQNTHGASQDAYRGHMAKKPGEITHWFAAQLDVARKLFGEYLTLTQR